jgi:hypothetical protein
LFSRQSVGSGFDFSECAHAGSVASV